MDPLPAKPCRQLQGILVRINGYARRSLARPMQPQRVRGADINPRLQPPRQVAHRDRRLLWLGQSIEALELYAMDFDWLSDLAQRLQRRTQFTLTVSEQHLYLSLGEGTLSAVVNRIPLGK